MPKAASRNGTRSQTSTKYDEHHSVLSNAYGALADLRRELADSPNEVAGRVELLDSFARCTDKQKAWLLLEDYLERLSLSRKDFNGEDWWPRMLKSRGNSRLEEVAHLFLRARRPLPSELIVYADTEHFAEVEEAEEEGKILRQLENWLFPPAPNHLDAPRAGLRVICRAAPMENDSPIFRLAVQIHVSRQRTGEKVKSPRELMEMTTRAAHEQELFPQSDWEFIKWFAETWSKPKDTAEVLNLSDVALLQWLARWGHNDRLLGEDGVSPLRFAGQIADLTPHLENGNKELSFTQRLLLPDHKQVSLDTVKFFSGRPAFVLVHNTFYLLRDTPPPSVLEYWARKSCIPVHKLSHRLLKGLRNSQSGKGVDWDGLCIAHPAKPRFVFELADNSVRLRLMACSDRDKSLWVWNGHEWQQDVIEELNSDKPELLDDPRLEPATQWLRQLDWFTPEPGVWSSDTSEAFLNALATAWPDRPAEADYLGDPDFHRLFLSPRKLRPRLVVKGSGIDWLSVSAEWEQEGMKLTKADLQRLQASTSRFVKLPDSGWVELDTQAVQNAHETMADLGVDGLIPVAQKLGMDQAAHLDEKSLEQFGNSAQARHLRERLKTFNGLPTTDLPTGLHADLRPYQKGGFDFLCNLTRLKLGGILADDMGLGKTLQTLAWLSWLQARNARRRKASLVICPASVLHNWRREAERFTPHMKVLVLESGSARHNLRRQIPQHDIIVTNYALLRRDLEALQKFSFGALVLDEAQFIKNPGAQVTQSVKQLRADHRLALTGTPLENRLLDLWSIVDFVQPTYLGTQEQFSERYEPKGENAEAAQRIARRRLSAKLRPLLLRRLKKTVARDLPDRIEERRDCELGEAQRKLYLAELCRSREQVMKAVETQGLNKSKMHVLAALTRLRQICCHPALVGSDTPSGKTETLHELLEPLLEDGQKVLVFSQFVQMLRLLEGQCNERNINTHILTGQTKNRQEIVRAFQEDQRGGVFLLSLRAAGTGLNLTNASYVVLYDPWWNPAVEAQAIDRSHRIGQINTVNAYRLIAPGTVEEKIWELQQRKAQTIADVLGEEGFARHLSKGDLEYLFAED